MKYVLLGVGRQGLAAVYDLVKYCEASELIALDARFTDPQVKAQVEQQLTQILPDAHNIVSLSGLDLTDEDAVNTAADLSAGADCMISALPYALNERASHLAIKAQVPMCDMGGNPDVVDNQSRLSQDNENHVLVPECGLAPGICNIFLKHLYEQYGHTKLEAFCGGLPAQRPETSQNPLQYKLVFSPQGLISEYMGDCPVLESDQIGTQRALTGLQRFDDKHEAFYTSNNSPRILEYLRSIGVKNCTYKTLRYHGHLEKIWAFQSLGFLVGTGNEDEQFAERLAQSEQLRFDRSTDRDKVLLSVVGSGGSGESTRIELSEEMDDDLPFTAMEKTTSWGTTIVAHAMASRRSVPAGFATPEQFVDCRWFIDELHKRTTGLTITN